MVEAAEPESFHGFIASTAGVAVAVVSKDEATGAAGDDGEATDAALRAEAHRVTVFTPSHQRSAGEISGIHPCGSTRLLL